MSENKLRADIEQFFNQFGIQAEIIQSDWTYLPNGDGSLENGYSEFAELVKSELQKPEYSTEDHGYGDLTLYGSLNGTEYALTAGDNGVEFQTSRFN